MPSRLVICWRSHSAGDRTPFFAYLRFGLWNLAMQSPTSCPAFLCVRWILRPTRSRLQMSRRMIFFSAAHEVLKVVGAQERSPIRAGELAALIRVKQQLSLRLSRSGDHGPGLALVLPHARLRNGACRPA